jgi:hypothetical protein
MGCSIVIDVVGGFLLGVFVDTASSGWWFTHGDSGSGHPARAVAAEPANLAAELARRRNPGRRRAGVTHPARFSHPASAKYGDYAGPAGSRAG